MNVLDAAYHTVHAYPGGSESLGPRIGISPAVLRSKVNPKTKTHRLAVDEADELMAVTGDYSILQALAAEHGFVLQSVAPGIEPGSICSGVLATNRANGELAEAIDKAIADNLITPNELGEIDAMGAAAQAAIIGLLARIQSLASTRHIDVAA